MSDAKLRDQERRCRDGRAALEEEVALLTGRLRAGTLTRERLDLAAHCGHEAARLAGGVALPPPDDFFPGTNYDEAGRRVEPRFSRRLRWWAVELRRWGPPVWARAVSTALAVSAEADPRPADRRAGLGEVVAAIEAWGGCPCEPHVEAARERARALGTNDPAERLAHDAVGAFAVALQPLRFGPFETIERLRATGGHVSIAGGLVSFDEASLTLLVHDVGPRRLSAMGVLHATLRPDDWSILRTPSAGQPFLTAAEAAGEDAVRRRVQEGLIAWALA